MRPVRSIRGQRVEAVHDREDARTDGDVGAADPIRVAGSVPVLVVVPDDRHDRIRKVDRREDLRADRRVQFHLLVFGRRQFSRLVEDVFGNRDLARVVQQRCRLDCFQGLFVFHAKLTGETHRALLDPPDVPVRDFVFGIDGGRQRFDGRQIQRVELFEVSFRVFHPAERRAQRVIEDEEQRRQRQQRDRPEVHLL
jgi:hypothetical protein